eukprot:CAMPEP_0170553568 /NCGR_PEP_ID=MMETSP0211-20121228/11402_1 /TAXON_ID=311385 /ORGANISM="Pseudokeronopsis sp., Strain OXSARD2" /LENGTH=64 /DNA_ID=CAMNT_0010861997 /DNA_START=298 /DNA_END=489 /DNA_ORIENTATION=-
MRNRENIKIIEKGNFMKMIKRCSKFTNEIAYTSKVNKGLIFGEILNNATGIELKKTKDEVCFQG